MSVERDDRAVAGRLLGQLTNVVALEIVLRGALEIDLPIGIENKVDELLAECDRVIESLQTALIDVTTWDGSAERSPEAPPS